MRRIDELDWLRGLMALAILFYHCGSFVDLGWNVDASTVLGKLGIYGVSIFFILSGLTLAHVYHAALDSREGITRFFVRRAFRIWPLLAFVVALKAAQAWYAGTPYSLPLLAANATGLFGFIWPTAYINVGAWSIGNEMVFYAFTPLLIWAYTRSRVLGNAVVIATTAIGAVFAFALLDPDKPLASQWATYVNPFNNLWLFAAGIAIFYNMRGKSLSSRQSLAILHASVALFVIFPAAGDQISIVTGFTRVVLSVASIGIVIGFYRCAIRPPRIAVERLKKLGEISYGVYLTHPFVIEAATLAMGDSPAYPTLFVAIVCAGTLAISAAVYSYLEKPMNEVGRDVTRRRFRAATA